MHVRACVVPYQFVTHRKLVATKLLSGLPVLRGSFAEHSAQGWHVFGLSDC